MGFKFNPLTGELDLVNKSSGSADNFSYKKIEASESKTIPLNQQMLFDGDLLVLGNLMVQGEAKEITNYSSQDFFYTTIDVGENVFVKSNRLLLYKENLMVLGNLLNHGTVGSV